MKPSIAAARNANATQRILAAAWTLAQQFGLQDEASALEAAKHRDPQLAALFQREAAADLLEALAREARARIRLEEAVRAGAAPASAAAPAHSAAGGRTPRRSRRASGSTSIAETDEGSAA